MEQSHYVEMDRIKHENELEIATIRVELERISETNKQRERDMDVRMEEFQSDKRLMQKHIDKVTDELKEIKCANITLKEEIEFKTREQKNLRHDLANELK